MDNKKKKEIEISSTITLKESFDLRIEDQKEYIASLRRDKKILALTVAALVGVILLLFVLDVCVGTEGWFQY